MRRLILFPLFSLGWLVFFSSCKKDPPDTMVISTPDQTINVKIAPNQSYQMDLTNAGTVSISRQAIHFIVSEAIVNNENGIPVYKYIPATDFTGNDEVVLLSTIPVVNYSAGNSGGCPGSNNTYSTSVSTKYIRLKITVGN
jgi:hypothetical protein